MKKTTYNKLVRDKIPEIIISGGKEAITEILSEPEYMKSLDVKLMEEYDEYQESKSLEELADMLEVIYAIAKTRGMDQAELEKLRKDKADTRGGFDRRIFLVEVLEK